MGIDDERFYHVLSGFFIFQRFKRFSVFLFFFSKVFFGSVDYAAEELRWRQVVISSCAAWRRAASID